MADLLNATELSKRLRVTRETILAWARRGWIPCLRAGRRPVLFDPIEVEKVLRGNFAKRERDPLRMQVLPFIFPPAGGEEKEDEVESIKK